MKKYFHISILILLSLCLCACIAGSREASADGRNAADDNNVSGEGKIKIVTTIFPEYDWVMNILSDNPADIDVTLLLKGGTDLHSYQPTVEDIAKISDCDLFIYVGGESDAWVEDAISDAVNKDIRSLSLLKLLGDHLKEEELVEGMQGDEDEDEDDDRNNAAENGSGDDTDNGKSDDDDSEKEYDEHVWLSLKNAILLTEGIAAEIEAMDPDNAKTYEQNTKAYVEKLSALDEKYQAAVSDAGTKTLLFGDRFPFRYLTDDYGITYYAAFAGCLAETEASFETITFLSEKMDELGLSSVMTIEGNDHRIAETIVNNTKNKDQQILTLDSLQSVTGDDIKNGTTYLSVMEDNLKVLTKALN
ncbi:MAG: metal ABC transporter substrate-binding protein [Lachnospiraceae bacterium]|nr:metal ABC transporter substrate-binding protein [Lachnospiraceae bacterium]